MIRALAGALVAATVLGCGGKPPARSPRVPVRVATASERPMPFVLTSVGSVEAIQTASVGSQVGGVLVRVAFREGDYVREGQTLFQLDPRPFRAAYDQAVASLERDRARARTALLNAERSKSLLAQNLLSEAEWDQARADAQALAATVAADSAAADAARLDLEYATIRAPIAGRTGRLRVHEGDYIKAATTDPLVTIIQPSPVRVAFTIPEGEVPELMRHREPAPRVLIEPDSASAAPLEGKLVFVDNAVAPATGTLLLKGEFPNQDGRLLPGQSADVRLVLYVAPHALVVPSPAVTMGQQGAFVYVVNSDSTVVLRAVQVERTVDEWTVLRSGLRPGETVVTDGQIRLTPGARISVRKAGSSTP
jgi:multidrug efflux system membrane fusion protein